LIVVAVAAVAIGVLALVQGGKDDTTNVGPAAVADAAERTSRVAGVRYSMTGETELPGAGKVRFEGSGVSDIKGGRGSLQLDLSEFAKTAPPEAGADDPDNWQMEGLFDGRWMYLKFPLLESGLGGKSWLKFDLLAVSEALGIDESLVRSSQQQGSDPTATLRYLRATSDDVERVGTEDVRGVQTTHYRATVDLRKYPNVVPADDREQARRSIERLIELSGDDESDMEVWVGRDKLIHRMKWEQSMKPPGTQQVVRSTYTSDFYDFGAKVKVQPPPADDTKDVTEETVAQLKQQGP
jgi:hypothetical protein